MSERVEQVPIPSSFPRVVFNRLTSKSKNGETKVWYSCSSYESHTEGGKTVKSNVKRIGLIKSESGLGEIEFNYRFLKQHPEFDNLVVCRVTTEKKGRNSVEVYRKIDSARQLPKGSAIASVTPSSNQVQHSPAASNGEHTNFSPSQAYTVKFGLVYFLMLFIESLPLGRALKRACLNKKSLFDRIVSLLYFVIVHGIDHLYDMELWASEHLLPADKASFDKDCIARIMAALDSKFIHSYYVHKHAIIAAELKAKGIPFTARTAVAMDSTNFDAWTKDIMAAHGNNKSGSDAKIVNLLVLMDQESCNVYFHQTLAGNVADITTLESAIRHCEFYSAEAIMIVADRGYWSVYNTSVCYAHQVSFLIHVKLHSTALKKMIAEQSSSLLMANNCVLIEHKKEVCFGMKLEREWSWYSAEERCTKRSKINFYVYFNMELFQSAVVSLHKKVEAINQALNQHKQECIKAAKGHRKQPTSARLTVEQEKLISRGIVQLNTNSGKYELNEEVARTHCVVDACWMLASDRDLDIEQAFTLYRQRNQIECLNRDLKNTVGLDTNGAQTRDSYEARQFLGLLAAEAHIVLRHKVLEYNKTHTQNEQAELKHNSVHCTLMDLEKVEATYNGTTLVPTSNMSLKHHNLFRACGLDPVELKDERLEKTGLGQGIVEDMARDDYGGDNLGTGTEQPAHTDSTSATRSQKRCHRFTQTTSTNKVTAFKGKKATSPHKHCHEQDHSAITEGSDSSKNKKTPATRLQKRHYHPMQTAPSDSLIAPKDKGATGSHRRFRGQVHSAISEKSGRSKATPSTRSQKRRHGAS